MKSPEMGGLGAASAKPIEEQSAQPSKEQPSLRKHEPWLTGALMALLELAPGTTEAQALTERRTTSVAAFNQVVKSSRSEQRVRSPIDGLQPPEYVGPARFTFTHFQSIPHGMRDRDIQIRQMERTVAQPGVDLVSFLEGQAQNGVYVALGRTRSTLRGAFHEPNEQHDQYTVERLQFHPVSSRNIVDRTTVFASRGPLTGSRRQAYEEHGGSFPPLDEADVLSREQFDYVNVGYSAPNQDIAYEGTGATQEEAIEQAMLHLADEQLSQNMLPEQAQTMSIVRLRSSNTEHSGVHQEYRFSQLVGALYLTDLHLVTQREGTSYRAWVSGKMRPITSMTFRDTDGIETIRHFEPTQNYIQENTPQPPAQEETPDDPAETTPTDAPRAGTQGERHHRQPRPSSRGRRTRQ